MSGLKMYINQDKLKDYNPIYILEIDEFDRDYRTITRTYRYLTNDPDAKYFDEEYEEWSGYSYFKTKKFFDIIQPYLEDILKLDIKLNDDDVIFIRDKV